MFFIKKTIHNITQEMEETVQNNGKQMKELYDIIEKQKKEIEYLNNELSILRGEKYCYENKIKKLEKQLEGYNEHIKICDKINIDEKVNEALKEQEKINKKNIEFYKNAYQRQIKEIKELNSKIESYVNNEGSEYTDLINKINDLNEEIIELKNINNQYKQSENEIDIDSIKNKLQKEFQAQIEELKLKHIKEINELKNVNIPTPSTSDDIKLKNVLPIGDIRSNDKLDILTRYPIKQYNINEIGGNEIKALIAAENSFKIKYQYQIAKKLNKNIDSITMDEIIDFKIKQENLNPKDKYKLKRKIERCYYLYNKYGDKLNILKFSLRNVSYMNTKDWELWLEELDKIIQNIPENCQYVFKKGARKDQKCGVLNCKDKRHNINID